MKRIALFVILGLGLLLSSCNNSEVIVYTQNDFLRTFNTRLEEEKLNYYMLVSLDAKDKGKSIEMMGFNKNKDLQVEMIFDVSGRLKRFGLLTNKIDEADFKKIIAVIKKTFPNANMYDIKEGVSPNTGYKGIGYFLKEDPLK